MTTRHLPLALTLLLNVGCVPDPGQAAGLPAPLPSMAPTGSMPAAKPSPSASPVAPASPVASPSPRPTASPTPSPSATASPSSTPTPAVTPSASPSPSPSPSIVHALTINAQTSQSLSLPTAATLDLEARIEAPTVDGLSPSLLVFVNGQAIRQAVTNRAPRVTLGSGQQIDLFNADTNAWSLLFSPDYDQATTSAAGDFQVTSEPGQAYRYVWNISAQKGTGAAMTVRFDNLGQGSRQLPLKLKVYQR